MRVLFVCLGNICRSPMAEFVLRDQAHKAGLGHIVQTASAGTSGWHNGEDMHLGTHQALSAHGISPQGFVSSQIQQADGPRYDYIVAMDDHNIAALRRILFATDMSKVSKMTDWLVDGAHDHVPDPYYTGDFGETWRIVAAASVGLLAHIQARLLAH